MKLALVVLATSVVTMIYSFPIAAQITCTSGSACQTNFIPVFASNGGNAKVTDSLITQSGSGVTVNGNLSANIFQIGGTPFAFGSVANGNALLGFAGNQSISGNNNTAAGVGALADNTTGFYNTAHGFSGLMSNTTGTYNTAIGTYSLLYNTSGGWNTASGMTSLVNNTTGSFNNASGYESLYRNTTGTGNVADGPYALFYNVSGNYNTAIGYSAGPASAALFNTSAIGAFAAPTVSNSLILGGTGASAVNVGIGTPTPFYDYGLTVTTSGQGNAINGGVVVNASGGNLYLGMTYATHKFRVDTNGVVYADGGFQSSGADFAESVAVRGNRSSYEPGDVLEIDPQADRHLALSSHPYATLVAGIYSTKPGVLASPHHIDDESFKESEVPLAVVGIVPCKVTAENGAIDRGDLLVTSSTAGYAMKGTDRSKLVGAVVGKALEPLPKGRSKGVIEVLITLQ